MPADRAPAPPSATGRPPAVATARRSVAGRLAVVVPVAVGALIVEGIFATRGQPGDVISLPAAGLAMVALWMGIAWALRSWVVLLMTFVPAIMVALGAAMVGGLAPGAGGALLLVGLALIGGVVSFRLSAPARRWSPGWFAVPPGDRAAPPAVGSWPYPAEPTARPGEPVTDAPASLPRLSFRPLDPLGAHFLHPTRPAGPGSEHHPVGEVPDRAAPGWDTSRTDVAARDRLVALLCRRGGTTGPTLTTLEEFFTGNGDPRSIAPGLRGAVPLASVNAVLHRLREHREVAEVLIQMEPLEAGRYPAGEWPAAGSVHVIATLSADEIDGLVADLRAEPVLGPLPATELTSGGAAPAGSSEFALWWA